jgi:hypothetical protein
MKLNTFKLKALVICWSMVMCSALLMHLMITGQGVNWLVLPLIAFMLVFLVVSFLWYAKPGTHVEIKWKDGQFLMKREK